MIEPRARHDAAAAICAALALAVAIGLGRFGFTAVCPLMERDGIVGLRSEGAAQALHFLGYFVGAVAVVRIPRSRVAHVCAAGLVASVILLAATAVADRTIWIFVDRFLSGAASAVVMVMASTWLFQAFGTGWAPVLYGGAGFGIVMAGACTAALSSHDASSRSAWLALAATAAVLAAPPLFALNAGWVSARSPASPIPDRPDVDPWRLVLVYAAGGFGYVISATYLPALVVRATGDLDPIHVFWFFGLCAVPSCLIWLRVDAAWGTRRALTLNYTVQLVGTVLPLISSHPAALLAAATAVGGTFMGVVATAMAAGRRHAPGLSYNLMAVLTAAYALGQAFGPAIAALLSRTPDDLNRPLGLAAAVLALAISVLCRSSRRFEIGHANRKHHGLGGEARVRLGASLARLEAQIGPAALIDRVSWLRPGSGRPLRRKASHP